MKNKLLGVCILGVLLLMSAGQTFAVELFNIPTGVIYHDAENAQPGYNLYFPDGGDQVYLFDNDGNLVHTWPAVGNPQLCPDGSILGQAGGRDSSNPSLDLVVYDWDGNETLRIPQPDGAAFHHDWHMIWDPKKGGEPTIITIVRKYRSKAEVLADGFEYSKPSRGKDTGFADTDAIREYDMSGNLIWEWEFYDRFVQTSDPGKPNYDSEGATRYRKFNTTERGPIKGDYNHSNSLDYNPRLDQIVINPLTSPEVFIVDHSITWEEAKAEKGDFLYRWGSTFTHGVGTAPIADAKGVVTYETSYTFDYLHNIHWIDEGLPGAGNLLVFVNTFDQLAQSAVMEINPFKDADGNFIYGNYVKQEDAGYAGKTGKDSNQVEYLWYSGKWGAFYWNGFYSWHISGVQKQPNGNYLICSGESGHIFEIQPGFDPETGEIDHTTTNVVWEFKSPVIMKNPANPERIGQYVSQFQAGDKGEVFRLYRFQKDHPALAGRNLIPMGKMNDKSTWYQFTGFGLSSGGFGNGGGGATGDAGGSTGGY